MLLYVGRPSAASSSAAAAAKKRGRMCMRTFLCEMQARGGLGSSDYGDGLYKNRHFSGTLCAVNI
jgi:hypothetical protein